MFHWDDNKANYPLVGVMGQEINYNDLPASLKSAAMAAEFGPTDSTSAGAGVLVCGSPGEVENDPTSQTVFDLLGSLINVGGKDIFSMNRQKQNVWAAIALEAEVRDMHLKFM